MQGFVRALVQRYRQRGATVFNGSTTWNDLTLAGSRQISRLADALTEGGADAANPLDHAALHCLVAAMDVAIGGKELPASGAAA